MLSAAGASSNAPELLLITFVVLTLLAFLAAAVPERALPWQLSALLDGRRESLVFTAAGVLLALLLALLIAHAGS